MSSAEARHDEALAAKTAKAAEELAKAATAQEVKAKLAAEAPPAESTGKEAD